MVTAFVRTVILYFVLMLGLRLLGKRQIGELEPTELVLTLLISDLAAVPMQDLGIPLANGIVPIATLLALSLLLSQLCLKSLRLRRLVCGEPSVLICNGILQQAAMAKNRFTLDELFEQLRSQGICDLASVKYAVLETDGELSVLLYADQQPLTPHQLGRAVADEVSLPTVFINDGRILRENLKREQLSPVWLEEQLRAHGYRSAKEVFLLSRSAAGKILCIGKEGRA